MLKLSNRAVIDFVFYYRQRNNLVFTTHVSYLEIYNDSGYDLLDPRHEASKLEDLPYVIFSHKCYLILIWYSKVRLLEDSTGNIHLKNLSLHQATNEEEGKILMKDINGTQK